MQQNAALIDKRDGQRSMMWIAVIGAGAPPAALHLLYMGCLLAAPGGDSVLQAIVTEP